MVAQRTFNEFMEICEVVYGGEKKEPKDTRMVVTVADKKGNTKAWQNYNSGDKRYKASAHLTQEETELDEVLMITPPTKQTTNKVAKKVTKIEKPDPSDPDYITKQRAYIKAKQQEAVDYERMRSGAEAASERAAAYKDERLKRRQGDAEAARSAFRSKGVPFSDAKGSGHIVNGKKVYAS